MYKQIFRMSTRPGTTGNRQSIRNKKKKKTYHFYSRLHTTATENIFTEIMHLSADPSVTRDSLHLPANREVRLILK